MALSVRKAPLYQHSRRSSLPWTHSQPGHPKQYLNALQGPAFAPGVATTVLPALPRSPLARLPRQKPSVCAQKPSQEAAPPAAAMAGGGARGEMAPRRDSGGAVARAQVSVLTALAEAIWPSQPAPPGADEAKRRYYELSGADVPGAAEAVRDREREREACGWVGWWTGLGQRDARCALHAVLLLFGWCARAAAAVGETTCPVGSAGAGAHRRRQLEMESGRRRLAGGSAGSRSGMAADRTAPLVKGASCSAFPSASWPLITPPPPLSHPLSHNRRSTSSTSASWAPTARCCCCEWPGAPPPLLLLRAAALFPGPPRARDVARRVTPPRREALFLGCRLAWAGGPPPGGAGGQSARVTVRNPCPLHSGRRRLDANDGAVARRVFKLRRRRKAGVGERRGEVERHVL